MGKIKPHHPPGGVAPGERREDMKYIYSHSLNDMVVESFYWNGRHYTWNDADCVFYNDKSDEDYWMTVPDDAY